MSDSPAGDANRRIVIGGGVTGLALAMDAVRHQVPVAIIDSGNLGGLTATETLDVNGQQVTVDRFYHVILEGDTLVRELLTELGLEDEVRWTAAPAAIVAGGKEYPATSLVDMAMLPALKLVDRARIGASIAASLALPMRVADRMTAVSWIRRAAGTSAFTAFWMPILRAKLGNQADRVSASFLVSTFRRLVQARLQGAGDKFGVLPGGYAPVFAAMRQRLQDAGADIRTGQPVTSVAHTDGGVLVTLGDGTQIAGSEAFVTTPGPVTKKIVEGLDQSEQRRLTSAPYLGVVCGSFLLAQPPNDSYITYLVDDVDLTGVIGMHALLPPEFTGGASLVYLPHYCASDDEWFSLSDDEVRSRMLAGLKASFPEFEPEVLASSINRAPYVVPLPLPGAEPVIGFTTSVPGVYVVGTEQNTTGTLNVQASLELVRDALRAKAAAGRQPASA